jgi:calcineurin-like phosphoesterase family protein
MIYVTSDCHFNHASILSYEQESRPFNSIKDMNFALIENWNSIITNNDTVYILGDFILGNPEEVLSIVNSLNGHKILIRGNHDSQAKINMYKELGIEVKDLDFFYYKEVLFFLCHFPYDNQEFFDMILINNPKTISLYGHVHSNAPIGLYKNTYHVGVDTNNFTPVSLEYIYKEYKNSL